MPNRFTHIISVDVPEILACDPETGRNPDFEISFKVDGEIPFPQVILRRGSFEYLSKDDDVWREENCTYVAMIPAGCLESGEYQVQIEGCRVADISQASPGDWIKWFASLRLEAVPEHYPELRPEAEAKNGSVVVAMIEAGADAPPTAVKIYFGIHKHMHQPYYQAANPAHWDDQKDEIFGSRGGAYTHFIPAAVSRYIDGGLPHAGLSTSWSGSLIEQLNRCSAEGLCGGRFTDWSRELREIATAQTARGHPRADFAACGFYHPLMSLIPARDIVKQIEWHRNIVRSTFGVDPSAVLFPPETAVHVRMIPALLEAGIEAFIYDSIHRFRACRNYPYAGIEEGMLPPNPAEQENPAVDDWMQLHNIWAGSKISPSLLKPEYVKYEDAAGVIHKIIAVPAERYIGNEDARGGFGALQYPDVLGQLYEQIAKNGSFDPQHPPFFLLHSDGDNHGGGAESYYTANTGRLIEWIKSDPRFELITVRDYLEMFPPDPDNAVHLEPGSWSGADNGDPQFRKWFSLRDRPYSPDLNSWAVLTALQNTVHSLEDLRPNNGALEDVQRLLLTSETSCYWYWTGQEIWDRQVTNAANQAFDLARGDIEAIMAAGEDRTGPTVFAPWVAPENPGGEAWGHGCLVEAPAEGIVHTLVHDISGLKRVTLILRTANGEQSRKMEDHGPYPSQTNPGAIASHFTAALPVHAGDARYYIEAEDAKGNITRSSLERVFLA